jgi:anti-sigma B factor antagonist
VTKAAKKAMQVESEPPLKLKHTTLSCMGELDRDALRAIRDRMVRLLDQGCVWLVLDLSDVSHIDYRGVPWLVSQAEEYRARGGDVKLAGVSRYLQAIFRAAGAHDAFEIYTDAGDARAALSQGHNAWLH